MTMLLLGKDSFYMMSPEIIKIDPENDDHVKMINVVGVYAFHKSPSQSELEVRLTAAKYRSDSAQFLLKDGNRPLAAATIHPLTQNLRGVIVKAGGVATVGSMPLTRRKGYVKQLMHALFKDMRENGQAISVLHPFRESFYERYGYVSLTHRRQISLDPASLRAIKNINLDPSIDLEQTTLSDSINETEVILRKIQKTSPGMIMFSTNKYSQLREFENWTILAKRNGQICGIMTYSISGHEGELDVYQLCYIDVNTLYSFLNVLYNHTDHVKTVKLPLRTDETLEYWLPDVEWTVTTRQAASVRIIDVHAINKMKIPVGREEIHINIIDNHCKWNNGNFRISSDSGYLHLNKIEEFTQQPDKWVDIKALSALLYGRADIETMKLKGWLNLEQNNLKKLTQIFTHVKHETIQYF